MDGAFGFADCKGLDFKCTELFSKPLSFDLRHHIEEV